MYNIHWYILRSHNLKHIFFKILYIWVFEAGNITIQYTEKGKVLKIAHSVHKLKKLHMLKHNFWK